MSVLSFWRKAAWKRKKKTKQGQSYGRGAWEGGVHTPLRGGGKARPLLAAYCQVEGKGYGEGVGERLVKGKEGGTLSFSKK